MDYVPLKPVADYVHMLDLNNILRVCWKNLPNLNFKLKFQTQISNSNLNFKKLKSSLSYRVTQDSGKLTPMVKGTKAKNQWVGFYVKQWVAQGVGRRVFKIVALPSCFHFNGLEEKVSHAIRKFVSSCLGILYHPPVISHTLIWISNSAGAKLCLWHLRINYFDAISYLRRNCIQRGHCLAGAKLSRWYSRIISFRRQLGST